METTLASRSLAPRIARLRRSGYEFRLVFLFVPNADFSVERVAGRVRQGGHHIPEETIRRRYMAGIKNFFALYRPLADSWAVHDTTKIGCPAVIARGRMDEIDRDRRSRLLERDAREGESMAKRIGKGILGNPDATAEEISQAMGEGDLCWPCASTSSRVSRR